MEEEIGLVCISSMHHLVGLLPILPINDTISRIVSRIDPPSLLSILVFDLPLPLGDRSILLIAEALDSELVEVLSFRGIPASPLPESSGSYLEDSMKDLVSSHK